MHNFMAGLGAEGTASITAEAQPSAQVPLPSLPAPAGPACDGWRVSIFWGGDGLYHKGDIIAYDPQSKKHHMLYLDGEEEWVDLSREAVVWHRQSNHKAISVGPHLSRIGGWRRPGSTHAVHACARLPHAVAPDGHRLTDEMPTCIVRGCGHVGAVL